jgi:aryl-alcohol dehydrogenase-like predicted oxidoreductase
MEMLSYRFPFDSCQLPLNGFDATFRSFEQVVLPELNRQGIAALGMKSFGAGEAVKHKAVTPAEALRYAMSLPVTTTISGIDSMRVLRQNLKVAEDFKPMSATEMRRLRTRLATEASDGRYELYKTTAQHDGVEGREQHGFPSFEELAG